MLHQAPRCAEALGAQVESGDAGDREVGQSIMDRVRQFNTRPTFWRREFAFQIEPETGSRPPPRALGDVVCQELVLHLSASPIVPGHLNPLEFNFCERCGETIESSFGVRSARWLLCSS
jgi:hypothetical protein